MKCYIARHVLIVQLAALALSALCFLQAQVRAQGMTGYTVIFPSVGLAPGQSLRLTLFNPDGAPLRAQVQLHHAGGLLVGLGDGSVRLVRGGTFHTFEFKRSDIPLQGEASTGRLQLRASCYISVAEPWKKIDGLAVSMETISISDGTSNTIFVGEILPSPAGGSGNDVLIGGDARDNLMGIVPGRTLRISLFNPPSSGSEAGSEAQHNPVGGHVKVFDGSGNLIAQSPELIIPPGEFRSFDFNRAALNLPGEPGTGRLQVRARVIFDKLQLKREFPTSVELVDNSTGQTGLLLPVMQQLRCDTQSNGEQQCRIVAVPVH